jgi:hypothetical protein
LHERDQKKRAYGDDGVYMKLKNKQTHLCMSIGWNTGHLWIKGMGLTRKEPERISRKSSHFIYFIYQY